MPHATVTFLPPAVIICHFLSSPINFVICSLFNIQPSFGFATETGKAGEPSWVKPRLVDAGSGDRLLSLAHV